MQNIPRKPTPKELEQLTEFTNQRFAYSANEIENLSEAQRLVELSLIAVFDDYETGGPGFYGKLMMVVWDGSPNQYEVYSWDKDNRLVCEQQEEM